jgi:hypothetical protein
MTFGTDFNSRLIFNIQITEISGTTPGPQAPGDVDFSDVQLEEGPIPTPFEARSLNTEQQLCMRYYEDNYPGGVFYTSFSSPSSGGFAHSFQYNFSVRKRVAPSMIYYNDTYSNIAQNNPYGASVYGFANQLVSSTVGLCSWYMRYTANADYL